ncbi:MAG TPA: response regulator [Acidobacteriaceae bacterium]|jgi:DNA-binding response OmpR family regulator|nr:response regulator [Acidobacteriaceae bacterium]
MKRRVLLVDDEISILLTLKAVLEISGFDVDTATSAHEGKRRIKQYEYEMIITDMRMEDHASGTEVIACARTAAYKPAIALLTAFPVAEEDWQSMGADEMLVKPMHTQVLLRQIEAMLVAHEDKKRAGATRTHSTSLRAGSDRASRKSAPVKAAKKKLAKKKAVKKPAKPAAKKKTKAVAKKKVVKKKTPKRSPARKKTAKKKKR